MILMIPILILILILFILLLSSILVTYKDWKYYKLVYNNLNNMRFNTHNNKVCGYMPDTVDITFIWYSENNSFYLSDRVYIFNCTHEYFNPYTLYWMFKYRTFCNRNLRHYLN